MFCKSCGNELNDKAVVCPKCGAATENFAKEKQSNEVTSGGIASGYILGALFPIIGVGCCIYMACKGKPQHAVGIGITSLVAFFMWAAIFS